MAIKVSITGTLSMPRKEAVQLIESQTSARFSRDVTTSVRRFIGALEQTGLSLSDMASIAGVEESKLDEIMARQYIETRIERAVLDIA